MSESTGIRVNRTTLESMRIAATELAAAHSLFLSSDDERINALVDHWNLTKHNNLTPAVQDATGDTTPSPR